MMTVAILFGFIMCGMLGWIFGHMTGQADLLREQNDRAMVAGAAPAHPGEGEKPCN